MPLTSHNKSGAVRLLQGVASAIGYFHSTGLVHGDIKLENVLVEDRDGAPSVAVIDFDDCYPADNPPSAQVLGGTPSHFAPEVIAYIRSLGKAPAPGIEADVFSAALVMHEMAVGRLPRFQTRDQMLGLSLLRGATIDLTAVRAPFAEVLRPMLSTEPAKRPTLASVYQQLAELDDEDVVSLEAGDEVHGGSLGASGGNSRAPTADLEVDQPLDPKLKINMRRR
jgi:serine/threonine protein kinase